FGRSAVGRRNGVGGRSARGRRRTRREVGPNQLDEFERRCELVLFAHEEVFDTAAQRVRRGIAAQLDDVGATVRVLGIGVHDNWTTTGLSAVILFTRFTRVVADRSAFGQEADAWC